MSKTIKVIDLLNKIANGEEVPEKIKCQNNIWTYEKSFRQYKNSDFRELVKALLGYYQKDCVTFTLWGALTCEVEIIEEESEIDIQEIKQIRTIEVVEDDLNIRHPTNLELAHKINELVKAVNQINNK